LRAVRSASRGLRWRGVRGRLSLLCGGERERGNHYGEYAEVLW